MIFEKGRCECYRNYSILKRYSKLKPPYRNWLIVMTEKGSSLYLKNQPIYNRIRNCKHSINNNIEEFKINPVTNEEFKIIVNQVYLDDYNFFYVAELILEYRKIQHRRTLIEQIKNKIEGF